MPVSVSGSSGHTREVGALLALESFAIGLSVLLGSKLEQLAPVFLGLCRVELELDN